MHRQAVPCQLVDLFKYWYDHQVNQVKWSGSFSEEYRLRCGVRQGGLSSPALFSLYVNDLIDGLSSARIGCSIHGNMINSISYADDMVLLSPSISALRRLLKTCEEYAESHGLRYNVKKSEVMIFHGKNSTQRSMPAVCLYGTPLNRVSRFKYLGHIVSGDLNDDYDIERERRALSVRCNMLARRFARCNNDVKTTLFKAYCQSFYTCGLWFGYTQRAYNALRIQYNNGFRMLLGLPRFCSASEMFAAARVDGFEAIMRKRAASLMSRIRGSSNSILKTVASIPDCPLQRHWITLHCGPNSKRPDGQLIILSLMLSHRNGKQPDGQLLVNSMMLSRRNSNQLDGYL
ncbi:uncharacterized protein LOC131851051 [Achroia grisella]|uniref:uncharacterized protein LOC131851051 n=1 Tax=Achroia grisella TaxID=688607 RepID=UPI0027D30A79|nr:uncharacterized protein LOC131851051 [Achroia grisella]